MNRHDGRSLHDLRELKFDLNSFGHSAGRVLASLGRTVVLCTCSIENKVPEFLEGKGQGWMTAEYSMLPGSTQGRKQRDKGGKVDGRSVEIQRLIGRSLRAVSNLSKLGERTLWIDCDVLQADGGTRVTAITGAWLAILSALHRQRDKLGIDPEMILLDSVAGVSVGLLNGNILVDLDYVEDKDAEVDLNLVMTGQGRIVEVQAGGEEATFDQTQLDQMMTKGREAISRITQLQRTALKSQIGLDFP